MISHDIIVEVPPVAGTLLAFKRSDNSWHGHEPFSGERRVIQFNWLTSQGNRQIAMLRHHTSASFKRALEKIFPQRAVRKRHENARTANRIVARRSRF